MLSPPGAPAAVWSRPARIWLPPETMPRTPPVSIRPSPTLAIGTPTSGFPAIPTTAPAAVVTNPAFTSPAAASFEAFEKSATRFPRPHSPLRKSGNVIVGNYGDTSPFAAFRPRLAGMSVRPLSRSSPSRNAAPPILPRSWPLARRRRRRGSHASARRKRSACRSERRRFSIVSNRRPDAPSNALGPGRSLAPGLVKWTVRSRCHRKPRKQSGLPWPVASQECEAAQIAISSRQMPT